MVKEVWRELNQSKSISHVSFGMMSSGQMMRLSHVPCVDKDMYLADQNHSPTPHGVLDPRLGMGVLEHKLIYPQHFRGGYSKI